MIPTYHPKAVPIMNVPNIFGEARPLLSLIGSIVIIVGLLKFFGVNIGIGPDGLQLALAGFLIKAI